MSCFLFLVFVFFCVGVNVRQMLLWRGWRGLHIDSGREGESMADTNQTMAQTCDFTEDL